MSAVLELHGVSVRFGGHTALDSVSFGVAPGEKVGILGPNGAGKTTLLDAIGGQCETTQGQITLRGDDITRARPARRFELGLSRTFQHGGLVESLSAVENVALADPADPPAMWSAAFGTPAARRAEAARRDRALRALHECGLSRDVNEPLHRLDEWSRRAVSISRVLVSRPRLVLLDEPTAGLDPASGRAILEPLFALRPSPAIILVEHTPTLITHFTGRALVLVEGRMALDVTTDALEDDPAFERAYPRTQ